MTKQLHTIRLINPCQQKWTGMQESTKGRFCSECEREVTDFTKFSNAELIDYFTTNKIKEGCGRFLTSQLETVKIPVDIDVFEMRRTPKWQKFLVVLLFCFGRNLFNAELVFGQNIANDSGRNLFFRDSSLSSETFDLKDTIKKSDLEPDIVCAEPETSECEQRFVIPDSCVYHPVTIEFEKSIDFILGGFGVYPEYKFPSIAITDVLQVPVPAHSKDVVENKPSIINHIPATPDSKKQDKTPEPEENNNIPLEAILTDNNQKKRKKKVVC